MFATIDPVNGISISPTSGFAGPSDVGTVNTSGKLENPLKSYFGSPSVSLATSTPPPSPQGVIAFGYFVSYQTLAIVAIVALILAFLFLRK